MKFIVFLLISTAVIAQAEETFTAPDIAPDITAQALDMPELENQEPVQEIPAEITPVVSEKPRVDNRAESEIPLALEKPKAATSEDSGTFRILFTLGVLGVVGAGAYFFLRKYAVPKSSQTQTQIKILQQHYLGPKKSLAIVRVAGESILIGVTDHNISMIKSLSLLDEEVPEEAPRQFDRLLDRESPESTSTGATTADEDFAIHGIKDIVSKRLKGMRSFQ